MDHFDLIGVMDVAPLIGALAIHKNHFNDMTFRQVTPGSPHPDTETLYLRMPPIITKETIFNSMDCMDYFMMEEPVFYDTIRHLERMVYGEAARAMIVKLLPDGHVLPHIDQGEYAKSTERFHLCITSNPDCVMRIGGEFVNAEPGEVWYFDKLSEHECFNGGDTDRIHLILDIFL